MFNMFFLLSILLFIKFHMWFAGHIKVLGGPYVARGPDVAHAFFGVPLGRRYSRGGQLFLDRGPHWKQIWCMRASIVSIITNLIDFLFKKLGFSSPFSKQDHI
jgi:hypothetical protein